MRAGTVAKKVRRFTLGGEERLQFRRPRLAIRALQHRTRFLVGVNVVGRGVPRELASCFERDISEMAGGADPVAAFEIGVRRFAALDAIDEVLRVQAVLLRGVAGLVARRLTPGPAFWFVHRLRASDGMAPDDGGEDI